LRGRPNGRHIASNIAKAAGAARWACRAHPDGDEADLKIYCDTSTLRNNLRDYPKELEALEQLQKRYSMFGSHLVHYEVTNTRNQTLREALIIDYNMLEKVPKDIRVLGFNTVYDQYGGFVGHPLISDVQDEALRDELIEHGLEPRDAEHITQQ
jgi:hypothetical protein